MTSKQRRGCNATKVLVGLGLLRSWLCWMTFLATAFLAHLPSLPPSFLLAFLLPYPHSPSLACLSDLHHLLLIGLFEYHAHIEAETLLKHHL